MFRRATTALACLGVVLAAAAHAESGTPVVPVVGHWEGSLSAGVALRLVLHIEHKDGALRATVDSPDQGATGIAVDTMAFDDQQLSLSIAAIRASYEARLQDDTLTGVWRQGGAQLTLNLQRVATPTKTARPQTPKPPFPYRLLPMHFDSAEGTATLAGTLTLPHGEGPFAAVVLLSGSGPQDRNSTLFEHQPFWLIADYLARHGIAALRYDDRGVAQSSGDFASATIEHFAQDALGAVAALARREDIQRIGILGHSEGAMVGDRVASSSPKVSFLIRLAGPAVDAQALLIRQSAALFDASGGNREDGAVLEALNGKLYTLAASDRGDEQVVADAVAMMQEAGSTLTQTQRQALGLDANLTTKASTLALPWFRDFIRRDAGTALAAVKVPVLALFGGNDTQVVAMQNAPAARERLVHERSSVQVYRHLNHLFQPSVTGSPDEYAQIEQTLATVVLDDIIGWINGLINPRE